MSITWPMSGHPQPPGVRIWTLAAPHWWVFPVPFLGLVRAVLVVGSAPGAAVLQCCRLQASRPPSCCPAALPCMVHCGRTRAREVGRLSGQAQEACSGTLEARDTVAGHKHAHLSRFTVHSATSSDHSPPNWFRQGGHAVWRCMVRGLPRRRGRIRTFAPPPGAKPRGSFRLAAFAFLFFAAPRLSILPSAYFSPGVV